MGVLVNVDDNVDDSKHHICSNDVNEQQPSNVVFYAAPLPYYAIELQNLSKTK